jgi:PTH1 family peptidyl-tRNA hydrolase
MDQTTLLPARQVRAGNCFFCDVELENIKLVLGLGNPGFKYSLTRHNIGFEILDAVAEKLAFGFQRKEQFALGAFVASSARQVRFVKPQTFMNNSGQVLPYFLKGGVMANQILVIHDELEKPLSNLALKFSGSARGHNGLKSIIDMVGKDFWRLQFGVGRPVDKTAVADFVLAKFLPTEAGLMQQTKQRAIDFFCCKKQ